MSHKGWVTLDDFLTQGDGEGAGAVQEPERADGAEAEAPSAEGEERAAEQEQAYVADQPHATPETGREPQASGELFTRRESEDMRKIRMTIEWWAKKHWFTIVDMMEGSGDFAKAIFTVRTDRMPLLPLHAGGA